ncbi:hypothetical protein G4228_002477 [Cervus hanglu yarkandensis]|nr:hypothetical protein G4228_002477 [Cervus hanglu yarkandensis]
MVEMIHLAFESGLTWALEEVKDDGSLFCILAKWSNVKLFSCTIIMLHESVKSFEMPNSLAGSDHPSFPHTPIRGNLPPLLPIPGKRWFPGSPDLVAAKSPLIGG